MLLGKSLLTGTKKELLRKTNLPFDVEIQTWCYKAHGTCKKGATPAAIKMMEFEQLRHGSEQSLQAFTETHILSDTKSSKHVNKKLASTL